LGRYGVGGDPNVSGLFAKSICAGTDRATGIRRNVSLQAFQTTTPPPGGSATTVALVVVAEEDGRGDLVGFARGFADPGRAKLTGSGALGSARLSATFRLTDVFTGEPVVVAADLTFTGLGVAERETDVFRVEGPDVTIASRFAGTFRDATQSGSLTINGAVFTPDTYVRLGLGRVEPGELTMAKRSGPATPCRPAASGLIASGRVDDE
jgi:hypothetical protein